MSLDRLKTLMTATALLALLGGCDADAGADTAQAGTQGQNPLANPLSEEVAPEGRILRFEDLPRAERETRLALGEQIVRLTAPAEFLDAIDESVAQAVRLNTPANYPDLTEEEQAMVNTLASEYAARYENQVIPRLREVYAYLYTPSEMQEIVAFLTSETGEKYRALTNEVNSELGQALQTIMLSVMDDVMREVRPEAFRSDSVPEGDMIIDLNAGGPNTGDASEPNTDPND